MAQVLVRDLEDETLEALKVRAKANKRSTAAEIREILRQATVPQHSPDTRERLSIRALAGSLPTSRTVEDIVADIRKLRDEWER